ncbi:class A beta-lactamase [Paraburkholderia antibiotica]|uniref:Beta-lactamase n=1 Tax=Paraburkholderia antibiotica TaxID=2728839 RepID=A0A7X9ZZ74_9BURK|nr:class A beta-lactamase [Paraburkholderia antibiotica]NML32470.1 class A beta-lactamase [Paraburkholderia antibiotica]
MITRRRAMGAMLGMSIAGIAGGSVRASGRTSAKAGTSSHVSASTNAGTNTGRTRTGAASNTGLASADALRARLEQLEVQSGGRLGVAIVDTTSGLHAGLRANERFPMCSTFKLLAVGLVLTRVDRGVEDLRRRIVFSQQDVVQDSPETSKNTRELTGDAGMSVEQLCKAALTLSDNTAANLLLASFGGPAAVTEFARGLGDSLTRLDRTEPVLNEARPGDPRDTTTPNAMLGNLRELALGERLSTASRMRLLAWLAANRTSATRIRAKLPADWGVGDKTGAGEHGTSNDIAILWPPQRGPILVAVYLTETAGDATRNNATIASVGALVVESVERGLI